MKCKGGHHKWYLKAERSINDVCEIHYFYDAMDRIHAPMIFTKEKNPPPPYVRKPMNKLFCRNCTKTQLIVVE